MAGKEFDHSKYQNWIDPNEVIPYDRNAKIHDDKQVANIANSIHRFGWQQDTVLTSDNVLVIGHGRRLAALKLGCEMPYHRIDKKADEVTDEDIRELRIADNQTNAETGLDFDVLGVEIEDLDFDGFEFDFLSISEQEQTQEAREQLSQSFVVPPLSILDTRQGYWQERKRNWMQIIRDFGDAREGGNKLYEARERFTKRVRGSGVRPQATASILDPVLCEVLLKWFLPNKTKEPKKCFDCFAGDTVFGFVAGYLGNEFIGTELRQQQADFNQRKCDEFSLDCKYYCDDGRNIDKHIPKESQDFFFSCPPYFDMEKYSDMENDASNQKTYKEFYSICEEAFSKSIPLLKQNRFAVVVCQDIRQKNGAFYGFPEDVIATFEKNGCHLYNRLILIRTVGSAAMFARTSMNSTRKARTIHEDVLVFFYGDESVLANEEDVVDDLYSDFLQDMQNVQAHQNVLVFCKGTESGIKNEFDAIGGNESES